MSEIRKQARCYDFSPAIGIPAPVTESMEGCSKVRQGVRYITAEERYRRKALYDNIPCAPTPNRALNHPQFVESPDANRNKVQPDIGDSTPSG